MSKIPGAEKMTKTVLLVEDNPTQALHLKTLLEQEGIHVIWAPDGESGVQMAQEQLPDLVVLDIQLPKMNGFQVCQQLKEMRQTADIPVIMLTRHDEAEAVVMGLQAGAIDYIPKDAFASAVLLETLRQMGVIAVRTGEG
jgi:twitching motility two-component system response regulator PilH